jgi:acyl carrier protein
MDRQAVEKSVREIVADAIGVDTNKLTEGVERDSHDWESVQNLNIILSVEVAFDRQFTPEQMETMYSIPRIVDVLVDGAA